jgi:hypothetical protein
LEGASIRQDSDSRHAIYGPKVTTRALLLGKVPAPSEAKPFLAEIRGAKAQAEGKTEAKQKPISHTKTVTGCLQKGDEPSEFSITGEDGKTWGVRSISVKLDQHVGHQVTVTGSAARETEAEENKEQKEGQVEKASSKEEYGDLRVTTLKMVSDNCSK